MNKNALLEELANFFSGLKQVKIEDLQDDSEKEIAKTIESLFTFGVDLIRNHPDKEISDLGKYAWNVIGRGHVLTAIGLPISSLHVSSVMRSGKLSSIIHVPKHWVSMFEDDPAHQLGGLVFVCSQAADVYNLQFTNIISRAEAFEGHFLRTMNIESPSPYQKKVMESLPVSNFLYERKEVA